MLAAAALATAGCGTAIFTTLIERFLCRNAQGFYERSLGWVLRRQPLMLVVIIITIGVTVYLVHYDSQGLFPAAGHRTA